MNSSSDFVALYYVKFHNFFQMNLNNMLCTNILLWIILDPSNLKIETFMEPI
jgi:hypothetical protein